MIIYIQCRKVDKVPKNHYERFYRGTAPLLQSILTYFFLIPLKKTYILKAVIFFFFSIKLNLPSCLIPKWYAIAQILLTCDVKVTGQNSCSIGKRPTQLPHHDSMTPASSWRNQCLGMIHKGTISGSIQFNVPDYTKDIKHPFCEESLLHSLAFSTQAFNTMERLADLSCPAEKP